MDASLTSYEFRAYRKRSGAISLYLRTRVLFDTGVSFSISAYLHTITGTLALPDGAVFDIDDVSIVESTRSSTTVAIKSMSL